MQQCLNLVIYIYGTVTKQRYKIRQAIDCRSKNIIHLVSCRNCPMQGVEQTENFQARVFNYISHILKRKQTCGIVKHFMETRGHSANGFRIMGIVQLENPPRSKADLKKRLTEFEGYWQIKLQTIEPYGMNTILEYLKQKGGRWKLPSGIKSVAARGLGHRLSRLGIAPVYHGLIFRLVYRERAWPFRSGMVPP